MLDRLPIDRFQLWNPVGNNDRVFFYPVVQQRLLDGVTGAGHVATAIEEEHAVPPHHGLEKVKTGQAERLEIPRIGKKGMERPDGRLAQKRRRDQALPAATPFGVQVDDVRIDFPQAKQRRHDRRQSQTQLGYAGNRDAKRHVVDFNAFGNLDIGDLGPAAGLGAEDRNFMSTF